MSEKISISANNRPKPISASSVCRSNVQRPMTPKRSERVVLFGATRAPAGVSCWAMSDPPNALAGEQPVWSDHQHADENQQGIHPLDIVVDVAVGPRQQDAEHEAADDGADRAVESADDGGGEAIDQQRIE